MDIIEIILSSIALIFTIFLVLYGLQKGFDDIEMITSLFYFSTLILQQAYSIIKELEIKH